MPILRFRKTETGKISRERTPGRRIWRPHFSEPASAKIGDNTFGFLIVLDGATSQSKAFSRKSTSPLEVNTKLHDEPEGDLCGYGLPPTS